MRHVMLMLKSINNVNRIRKAMVKTFSIAAASVDGVVFVGVMETEDVLDALGGWILADDVAVEGSM